LQIRQMARYSSKRRIDSITGPRAALDCYLQEISSQRGLPRLSQWT
jgi:hypothetical protein